MPSLEGILIKFRKKIYIPLTRRHRGKRLTQREFTILSNNCWGGTVYEAHDLKKQTPTVGLFFMAEDYIRFLRNIHHYLDTRLTFIDPQTSRWREQLCRDYRFGHYPIGVLDDIEILFLHYHSPEEATEKWERRIKRIRWDKLIVKFNDQNGCTEEEIDRFVELPFENKLFFTCKTWPREKEYKAALKGGYVKVPQLYQRSSILGSHEIFGRWGHFDMTEIINRL